MRRRTDMSEWLFFVTKPSALSALPQLEGVITSHTAPCYRRQRPRNQEVRRFLVDHLRQNGYDVSSLVPAK